MKKILLPILALGGLLFASSCQMDEPDAGTLTGEVDFTITAGIPGSINTYASNDGGSTNVDKENYDQRFILEVYDGENYTNLAYREVKTVEVGEKTSFDVRLLAKKYKFALWADFVTDESTEDYLYNTYEGLNAVKIKSNRPAGQEIADAYCYSEEVDLTDGSLSKSFTLRRPFGKIRLISTDKPANDVNNSEGYTPKSVIVTYGTDVLVPTGYNVLTGEAYGENTAAGDYTFTPYQEEVSAGGTKRGKLYILGIDYILASKSATSVSFEVQVDDNGARSVTNIPVSANKLTTVIGNFYTNEGNIKVIVEDEFDTDENVHEVGKWNGGSEEPAIDESNITINSAEQLAGLAKMVNEGEKLSGYTVTLNADIDLNNLNWTPIGTSSNAFEGNFNGNGHTISNLSVTVDGDNAGLFGYTKGGKVENISIHNAEITGKYGIGVVTGAPGTTQYSDIELTGLVKVEGEQFVGGILGGGNDPMKLAANLMNVHINVEDGSYVKASNNFVGGVVGAMEEGSFTVSNVSSNIDVDCEGSIAGGIVGQVDVNNKFENCSSSGNVTMTYPYSIENYAYMIGGIAGTWNDQKEGEIHFNECSFTGNLTSSFNGNDISGEIKETNKIVGRQSSAAYGYESKATLYIDGNIIEIYSYWDGKINSSGLQLNPSNKTATINSAGGLAYLAEYVNNGKSLSGYRVTLNTNIDLNGHEWTPIGTNEHPFSGIFDGGNHTVSNLSINAPYMDYVGLFGITKSTEAVVENLTLTNVDVTGRAQVGAMFGSSYQGTIKNCHVNGNIHVNGYYKVGGLSGEGYAKIINCSVKGNDRSTVTGVYSASNIEGDNVGGLIGYTGEGINEHSSWTVENLTVSGTRKVGGAIGYLNYNVKIDGVVVSNMNVSSNAEQDYVKENAGKMFVGGIVGEYSSSSTLPVISGSIKSSVISGPSAGIRVGGSRNVTYESRTAILENLTKDESTTATSIWYGESSTSNILKDETDKRIIVTDPAGFAALTDYLKTVSGTASYSVIIDDDIDIFDLNSESWTPVRIYDYKGIDGNGIVVRNVKVEVDKTIGSNAGLFAEVSHISSNDGNIGIRNVNVENAEIIGCNSGLGGSAGVLVGSVTLPITNCTVKNSSVTGGDYTGGIVGYSYGDVINCTVSGTTVTGLRKDAGGLIGFLNNLRTITGNKVVENTSIAINSTQTEQNIGWLIGRWNFPAGSTLSGNSKDDTVKTEKEVGTYVNGSLQ